MQTLRRELRNKFEDVLAMYGMLVPEREPLADLLADAALEVAGISKRTDDPINDGRLTQKEYDQVNAKVNAIVGIDTNPLRMAEKQAIDAFEFALSNYHNYPFGEHRLYSQPEEYFYQEDTEQAVVAAKSARFEHGEVPNAVSPF